ncbi:response regulator [Lysinibacillus sp. NPDC094403]|uniref:response regulator transcription factor n=1 Tax=Lysinibacillus sp. NPDC094403 TaxID=3390581 RepID=UPI003D02365C
MDIKIVIIDDHILLLESLKNILIKDPEIQVVHTISNPKYLLKDIMLLNPDILLMDIRLNSFNGLELTKSILSCMPQISIIILSGYNYEEYIEAAYNVGASAFITKEKSNEELIATIKQVYMGYKIFPKFEVNLFCESLTSKECEVLKHIAADKTNIEISEDMRIGKRTVEHHVSSIIRKLDVDSRVGAVVKAIKRGLLDIH